jgi:pyridoxamine 5'-phosphate oxidase
VSAVAGRYNPVDARTVTGHQMPTPNPLAEFQAAIARAESHGIDTTPVALATADKDGRPSARMVLLRGVDERGFVFHTNYHSRKGRELAENPFGALCFHWPTIEEQIRIEGPVERLPTDESDAYFAGRPRGSQIGAWASAQSEPLDSRATFERRIQEVEARFEGVPVPRPPFWGGFRIAPVRIEFWLGRESRLHDRTVYTRAGDGWTVEKLYP